MCEVVFSPDGSGKTPGIPLYCFQVGFNLWDPILRGRPLAFLYESPAVSIVIFSFTGTWVIKELSKPYSATETLQILLQLKTIDSRGFGTNFRPLDNRLNSDEERSLPDRFTTVRDGGLLSRSVGGARGRRRRVLAVSLDFSRLINLFSFSLLTCFPDSSFCCQVS